MEKVAIGVLLPGAQRFSDENVNPTWKAHVQTDKEITVAFIKPLSARKLYVECICATLGRHLGLPIPRPIIVQIPPHSIGIANDQAILAFGSEDAGYPSLRRHLNDAEAFEKLALFGKSLDLGVFDEWIANTDRNVGNVLFDGGNNFTFIDHEHSIPENLNHSSPASDNQMIRCLFAVKSEFEKFKLNRECQINVIPQYATVPLAILSEMTYATSYLSELEIVQVIKFLEMRIEHLHNLLTSRFQIGQHEMSL
ncbi:MAG: HipA family kinase [Cellvibrio sp.]